jgi:hypothetical protein
MIPGDCEIRRIETAPTRWQSLSVFSLFKIITTMNTSAIMPKNRSDSIANTKVNYRYLGKSGLKVFVPILGCQKFGDPQWFSWVMPEETRVRHFLFTQPYQALTAVPGPANPQACLR